MKIVLDVAPKGKSTKVALVYQHVEFELAWTPLCSYRYRDLHGNAVYTSALRPQGLFPLIGSTCNNAVHHCLVKEALNDPQTVSLQVELISVPFENMVPEQSPPDGRLEV